MIEMAVSAGRPSPKVLIIVILLFAVFAAAVIDSVVPVSLVDIASTFGIKSGEAARLSIFNNFARVATALTLGFIGLRYRYKSLVIFGLILIAACEIGLFLAPTFQIAQLAYPLNAMGSVLIVVTAETFIGNYYSLDRKAKAIGWVVATGYIAGAVGAPAAGFLSDFGGWRTVIIWFMLPTAIVSFMLVSLVFPRNPPEIEPIAKREPFMKGLRQVLANKSTRAMFVSGFLGTSAVAASAIFAVTFYRQVFSLPTGFASLVGSLAMTSLLALGAVVGGQMVNRVGRKRLTVVAGFPAYIAIVLSYFIPNLWGCLALRWIGAVLGGIGTVAGVNMLLELVPKFRGTAISIGSAINGIGVAISLSIGGLVLDFYNSPTIGFQALALIVCAFGIASTLVIIFFTKEPIKTQSILHPQTSNGPKG